MKLLYAIQGTGNGHISRAREIIPILQQHAEVDILISGTQADVQLSQEIKYRFHGFSFIFGKKGGVNRWETYQKMRLKTLLTDIKNLPVNNYDLVINDFEPVSAYACKIKKQNCIALSHQSSFLSLKTPRPVVKNHFTETLFKHYAPTNSQVGFHFKAYDDFIHTPVIRKEIRELKTGNLGHYTVYLPAYDDAFLVTIFKQFGNVQWHVFTKHKKDGYDMANVKVIPINNSLFNQSLANCSGLLTGGGFEGPAEALFLGKKLMMIPMKGQYEQQCNAEAAKLMGVPIVKKIDKNFLTHLKNWIDEGEVIQVNYPNQTEDIIHNLLKAHL